MALVVPLQLVGSVLEGRYRQEDAMSFLAVARLAGEELEGYQPPKTHLQPSTVVK
jgi:hypothetical protein